MRNSKVFSFEEVDALLAYDPETGIFRWKKTVANCAKAGSAAGGIERETGTRIITIQAVRVRAQLLAWFLVTKEWPVSRVSFKNGDRSDCRFDNLKHHAVAVDGRFVAAHSKEGNIARARAYREERPQVRRGVWLKHAYGVSLEWYADMLKRQNGVCAICKDPETALQSGKVRQLTVDHCHDRRTVRGLLCNRCNSALGFFGDNPDLMREAAKYVEHYRHQQAGNVVPLRTKKEA